MKSVYAFIHFAFGGVKAPSISVIGSSTSTTGSARRVPPPRGSLLAARLWASPSGSSSRSLFLTRGYTSCRGWPPADPFLAWVRSPFFIGYFFCVQFVFPRGVWVPGQTDVLSRLRSTSPTAIVSSTSSLSRTTSAESLRTGAVGRVSRLRSSISRSPLFRTPSLFLFACSRIACNCSLIF